VLKTGICSLIHFCIFSSDESIPSPASVLGRSSKRLGPTQDNTSLAEALVRLFILPHLPPAASLPNRAPCSSCWNDLSAFSVSFTSFSCSKRVPSWYQSYAFKLSTRPSSSNSSLATGFFTFLLQLVNQATARARKLL
jgi:hypothetical protein